MSINRRLNNTTLSANYSDFSVHQAKIVNRPEERSISIRPYLTLHGTLGSVLGEDRILKTAGLYRLAALIYLW